MVDASKPCSLHPTSLLKLPGLLLRVECIPACIACIIIDNALSMKFFGHVPVMCCGSLPYSRVLKILPTIWCMRSHIVLAYRFLLMVGTSLILQPCNMNWNSCPMNSPPLSWILLQPDLCEFMGFMSQCFIVNSDELYEEVRDRDCVNHCEGIKHIRSMKKSSIGGKQYLDYL